MYKNMILFPLFLSVSYHFHMSHGFISSLIQIDWMALFRKIETADILHGPANLQRVCPVHTFFLLLGLRHMLMSPGQEVLYARGIRGGPPVRTQ